MGDFPRPFSGGKNKKQKKVKIKKDFANARNAVMRGIQESVNFANTMHFGKQVAKKAPSERTKEMGGPNMETPLQGNAFTKAMADNDGNYEAAKRQLEGSGIKMISTGMPGTNPMTGMIQPNQIAPTAINPNALGSMQAQIPGIVGQSIPGQRLYKEVTIQER